jgi:diguanylate cyclase (GGDEF)-like protein/PAS domain S-box-containing protein
MTETSLIPIDRVVATGQQPADLPIVQRIQTLNQLLEQVEGGERREEKTDSPSPSGAQTAHADNQLVMVRLGIASSLFAALRCRSAATACHSLRVALSCSAWGLRLGLNPAELDAIEVAALLHDLGLVGVPDSVLLKPGPLNRDEMLIVEQGRRMSAEILRQSCSEPRILQVVENIGAWFDGSKGGYRLAGREIPAAARMIAIVDAFDSMTTDQVFRRAMSDERAMQELFASSGTQFDPSLVQEFAEFRVCDQTPWREKVARRWLHDLDPQTANSYWELVASPTLRGTADAAQCFERKLLENMHDAVMFIELGMRVVEWNRGAERLTGISATSMLDRLWSPTVLHMQNEKGEWLTEADCPVRCAIQSQVQSLRRLTISGRGGRRVLVDAHTIPVISTEGGVLGAVLVMHDASGEASLEQRCQALYEKATKDPLTKVANRAEFERVHEMFLRAHREQQVACSLIICDLDRFKRINDTYGHQVGDEVIQALANVLKGVCRSGDLVARYGGEEFVVLCADCDNVRAVRLAERARKTLSQIRHPSLGGQSVTASFGVTEAQAGDTAETMLRRADRALLMAKQQGRNRVVQLGGGADAAKPAAPPPRADASASVHQRLVTPVPLQVAVEKLRGFIADHQANVTLVEANCVEMLVQINPPKRFRRFGDRPTVFRVKVELEEESSGRGGRESRNPTPPAHTRITVTIAPEKTRERRRDHLVARASEVLTSFRSYLMANQAEEAEA